MTKHHVVTEAIPIQPNDHANEATYTSIVAAIPVVYVTDAEALSPDSTGVREEEVPPAVQNPAGLQEGFAVPAEKAAVFTYYKQELLTSLEPFCSNAALFGEYNTLSIAHDFSKAEDIRNFGGAVAWCRDVLEGEELHIQLQDEDVRSFANAKASADTIQTIVSCYPDREPSVLWEEAEQNFMSLQEMYFEAWQPSMQPGVKAEAPTPPAPQPASAPGDLLRSLDLYRTMFVSRLQVLSNETVKAQCDNFWEGFSGFNNDADIDKFCTSVQHCRKVLEGIEVHSPSEQPLLAEVKALADFIDKVIKERPGSERIKVLQGEYYPRQRDGYLEALRSKQPAASAGPQLAGQPAGSGGMKAGVFDDSLREMVERFCTAMNSLDSNDMLWFGDSYSGYEDFNNKVLNALTQGQEGQRSILCIVQECVGTIDLWGGIDPSQLENYAPIRVEAALLQDFYLNPGTYIQDNELDSGALQRYLVEDSSPQVAAGKGTYRKPDGYASQLVALSASDITDDFVNQRLKEALRQPGVKVYEARQGGSKLSSNQPGIKAEPSPKVDQAMAVRSSSPDTSRSTR